MLRDLSWLKRVKIIDENGNLINNQNPFPVQTNSNNIILWNTDDDWNVASVFSNTEVVGLGRLATVQLEDFENDSNDISYSDSDDYTYSDSGKIIVDVADSNKAELKIQGGEEQNFNFTTPSEYTYDTDDIIVENSLAELKPILTGVTFFANYNTNIDGTFGDGDLTGTGTNNPIVSAGALDLTGGTLKYVSYDADLNADSQQVGCVRCRVIPDYTGNPATGQWFFLMQQNASSSNNTVSVYHESNGSLYMLIKNNTGSTLFQANLGTWSPTSGVEYEIEFNWDITVGATRLFVDGVQFGTTRSTTGTRDGNIGSFRVGVNNGLNNYADFKMNWIMVFDSVQHTSNYIVADPDIFPTTNPAIKNNTGFVFSTSLDTFTETATKNGSDEIKYQLSSDDGTTYKWWNGATWIARTTSVTPVLATSINATTGTPTGNLASILALDANIYSVAEVTGNPGFNVEINFDNTSANVNRVTVHGYYKGNPAHVVQVQIWNYNTLSWVVLGVIPNSGATIVTQYDFNITGTLANYRDENGNILTRIRHTSNGSVGHSLGIDYIYLRLDEEPSDTWYYDNESNLASVVNTNIGSLSASGTLKCNSFLHSDDGEDTPRLDNIFISSPLTYSTDDNLYIDTKNTSHITPSNIVSWLTTSISNVKPANTDIKFLFSTDGRNSWLTWNGSSWVAPVNAVERQYATSITDAQDNFADLAKGNGTLDVRLFLFTSDAMVTPEVSNINVISYSGYATNGSVLGNNWDSGGWNQVWSKVEWVLVTPANTTFKIRVRTGNDVLNLGAWSDYLTNGQSIETTGRWINWQIFFTSDGIATPSLDEIRIFFIKQDGTITNVGA